MGPEHALRARLMRAIHAEGKRRKLDHDALHDLVEARFGVRSMAAMKTEDLLALYKGWTGHGLRSRAAKPARGEAATSRLRMVSSEEMISLEMEFAKRGLGDEGKRNFVRRQLRGRDQVRTRGDWTRVMAPLRAMNRREGKA